MEKRSQVVNGLRIAQALASDYIIIYYVNLETGRFIEYSASEAFRGLGVETDGEDFFAISHRNAHRLIHPDDREAFVSAIDRDRLSEALQRNQTVMLTYRMHLNGAWKYVQLKAVRMDDQDDQHVAIGVNDIDDQWRQQKAYEKARETGLTYAHIAQALAEDYFSIYYVDLDTEHFIEYSSRTSYDELDIEKGGSNFFELSRTNARRVLYAEDLPWFLQTFTRENVMRALNEHQVFKLTYRLMFNGQPIYVCLKATRLAEQYDNHIVIGVTSIDEEMRRKEAMQKLQEAQVAYSRIFALSGDYICLYTVDPKTGRYDRFSATEDYMGLGLDSGGESFFETARVDSLKAVYPEDQAQFNALFTEENVMRSVAEQGFFAMNYRLSIGGEPTYVCLKAAMVEEKGSQLLVVGVTNIDAQVRRERAYAYDLSQARDQASIDALTGVKNKFAYVDVENRLNRQIAEGDPVRFAVVVFDLNGLKEINDTHGHRAGDRFLKQACETICQVFKHSPVFRIGGDEFAVISQGQDYDHILELMTRMRETNAESEASGGAIIACGMARYNGDQSVSAVFERADERMYENKKNLKSEWI